MSFRIHLNGKQIAELQGMDIAWEIYFKAREIAELTCGTAELIADMDCQPFGEVIAYFDFEEA